MLYTVRGFSLSKIYIWPLLTNARERRKCILGESRKKNGLPKKSLPGHGRGPTTNSTHNPSNLRWYFFWRFRKKKRDTMVSYWWHVMSLIMWCVHRNTSCLTSDYINVISPWSTLAIGTTSYRFSILVKGLWCCSTGRTPATILNCKHAVTCSDCSHCTLLNRVFSSPICPIQNRILSFQG